jgi:hypothetical protein
VRSVFPDEGPAGCCACRRSSEHPSTMPISRSGRFAALGDPACAACDGRAGKASVTGTAGSGAADAPITRVITSGEDTGIPRCGMS